MKTPLIALGWMLCLAKPASAIKIVLDYSYDAGNFFSTDERKNAMRQVANYFELILKDRLAEINNATFGGGYTWSAQFSNPGTGGTATVTNLVVPADTLIVYVGGRDMSNAVGVGGSGSYANATQSTAWLNLINARGQTGALASPKTDFGPWGGSLAFTKTLPNGFTWNFSTTTPVNNQMPFVSIAMHEMGHLLGIGGADSWRNKISNNTFTGAASIKAYGSAVPMSDIAHWRDDGNCTLSGYNPSSTNNVLSDAFGLFNAPHGTDQIALMDPVLCPYGTFHKVMTDLDLAALKDIGWEFDPPLKFTQATLNPSTLSYQFSWPSSSNITYRIERSYNLTGSWTTVNTQAGNGDVQSFTTAAEIGQAKAFYRLNTQPLTALRAQKTAVKMVNAPASVYYEPIDGCTFDPTWGAD